MPAFCDRTIDLLAWLYACDGAHLDPSWLVLARKLERDGYLTHDPENGFRVVEARRPEWSDEWPRS